MIRPESSARSAIAVPVEKTRPFPANSHLAFSRLSLHFAVPHIPMKNVRLVLLLAVTAFVAAAVQAEDKKDAPAGKPSKCCASADAKGEKCSHDCCVEAAKAGDNCKKCGGSGKTEPKK